MRDRRRAMSLIEAIIEYFQPLDKYKLNSIGYNDRVLELIKYLFKNDKREPKSQSFAYNNLKDYFKDNHMINEYITNNML